MDKLIGILAIIVVGTAIIAGCLIVGGYLTMWIKENLELIVLVTLTFLAGVGIGAGITDAINSIGSKKK